MIKRFAAHYVFPVSSPPLAKGIVETDETGVIVRLIDQKDEPEELEGMTFFTGILCPALADPFGLFPTEEVYEFFPELQGYACPASGNGRAFELMKKIALDGSFPLEHLLYLFCFRTAKAAGRERDKGTLEPGKRPGIVWIDRVNFHRMALSKDSRIRRII